jgi:hypothetical protein
MDSRDRQLRYDIFQFVLENCRPPTIKELTGHASLSEGDVKISLKSLHDLHHLSLHDEDVPTPTPIAMVHPFSHL